MSCSFPVFERVHAAVERFDLLLRHGQPPGKVVVLGDALLYYIILLYYPVFSLSAYFDILDLDREDLLEKNRW